MSVGISGNVASMKSKIMLILSLSLTALQGYSRDLTLNFEENYKNGERLGAEEQKKLRQYDFYLVPGILSESFIYDDRKSKADFSLLTKDYFGAQKDLLLGYEFRTERLLTSSRTVEETKQNIRVALAKTRGSDRKAIFLTHSLGGLALLEELVSSEDQAAVGGIIFLQSPFQGSPVADVYFKNPYYIDVLLKPLLPFFNTSPETIDYLTTKKRSEFMTTYRDEISALLSKVPVITVAGVANGGLSLFRPAVNLMEYGCMTRAFNHCISPRIYKGSFDSSDGMVPLKSSYLDGADSVILEGADHGETVVNIPHTNFQKERMTEALLKLLLEKI